MNKKKSWLRLLTPVVLLLPLCPADPSSYQVDYRTGEFTRCLMVSTRAALTQEQIFALFDIIPGMEYCELQRDAYGMSKGWWLKTGMCCSEVSGVLKSIIYKVSL